MVVWVDSSSGNHLVTSCREYSKFVAIAAFRRSTHNPEASCRLHPLLRFFHVCTAMRSAFRQISRSSCYRTPIVGRLSLPAFHFIRSGCVGPRRQFSTGRGQWSNKLHRETRSTFSQDDSTIYALSTAPGRAAIAVIRISGPSCVEVRLYRPIF